MNIPVRTARGGGVESMVLEKNAFAKNTPKKTTKKEREERDAVRLEIIKNNSTKSNGDIADIIVSETGEKCDTETVRLLRKKADLPKLNSGWPEPGPGRPAETSEEKLKERKETRQENALARIREKRAKQQAAKPDKITYVRDPRFILEERQAWEWLVRITNRTAVAKKKKTVSNTAMALDMVSSGMVNVANDTVYVQGVQARVTPDMRAIARQGLRQCCIDVSSTSGNSKSGKGGNRRNL